MSHNSKKAVFLDRDGVVNACPGAKYYVKTWEDFEFLPGVMDAISDLNKARYKVFVLSNQSGVARGAMSFENLETITRNMQAELLNNGAYVDGVYYCTHDDPDGCACRKPKAGLFLEAARGADIDLAASYNIGDSERDIAAGNAMGIPGIIVLSGKTKAADVPKFTAKPVAVQNNLLEAVEWILSLKKS